MYIFFKYGILVKIHSIIYYYYYCVHIGTEGKSYLAFVVICGGFGCDVHILQYEYHLYIIQNTNFVLLFSVPFFCVAVIFVYVFFVLLPISVLCVSVVVKFIVKYLYSLIIMLLCSRTPVVAKQG